MAAERRTEEEYDYCITVGNQRGPAAQADGRRGHPILDGRAHPNWGEWFKHFKKIPLPHRMGAIFVYARRSEGDPWEEKLAHTTTQEREEAELELQANVTIDALRDASAQVALRQKEAASLAAQDRVLVDRIAQAEETLRMIKAETLTCRKILDDERVRCSREISALSDRLARETAAMDEMLHARRQVAAAEEARIQAALEAATMNVVKGHEENVRMRKKFTEAEGELLDAEAQAATMVAVRRRGLQAAATGFQTAILSIESDKLEALDSMTLGGTAVEGPRRETPGERIANMVEAKFKDATAEDVLGTVGAIIGMFRPKPAAVPE